MVSGSRRVPAAPWVRPADWLQLTTPDASDQKLVGLAAVNEWDANWVTVRCTGAFRVDWGDGAGPVDYASGVTAERNLSWGDYSSSTLTSRGYRQAVITVTPQPSQTIAFCDLSRRPAGFSFEVGSSWLDVRCAMASGVLAVSSGAAKIGHSLLESVTCLTVLNTGYGFFGMPTLRTVVAPSTATSTGTNFTYMFSGCYSLQSVPELDTSTGTNFAGMFSDCYSLQSVPELDTSTGTNFSSMFYNCYSLQSVPELDTSTGTNFSIMFSGCYSLQSVPELDTSSGTNFANMFNGCFSLQSVPELDTSTGTSFANMFNSCWSLGRSLITGPKYGISYANTPLTAPEIDAIFTRLGTAAGAQTITVTGTPGAATCTPSIATAKGWTVAA